MVDSHKVWLIAGISIAILLIAGLVFVPMIQGNFAGQATTATSPRSTSSTEEFKCPTCAVLPSSDQNYLGGYTDDCCKMVPGCNWIGSSTDRNNPGQCVSTTNQQQEGPAKGCADYSSFYKFGAIPDKARVQSCVGPCEYSVIDKVCKGGIEFSCDDGKDNDGDRLVDCIDPDCTEICNTPPIPPACESSCDGKVCGDDGCEGSCGECQTGAQCFNGRCITHDEECDNGIDDDNDLAIDCADLDCKMHDNCLSHDLCNEGSYTTFVDYPSTIKKGQSTYLYQVNGFFDSNACFKLIGDSYGRTSVSLINLPYSYGYSCEQIYKGIPVVKVHGRYGVPEFYQLMYKAGAGIKHDLNALQICPETLAIAQSYLGITLGKKGFWNLQEVRQCIDEGITNRKLTDLSGNNKYPVNEELTCTSQVSAPVCQPSCDGKTCGDDGCGGTCGTCPTDQTCQEGICTAQTETSCTNNYDDDKNGLADCDDPECFADSNCVCNDPDLENELYTKTTVTLGTQTNTDSCLEGGQLREYRCLKKTGGKDLISSAILTCPYGTVCQEGNCVSAGLNCIDPDEENPLATKTTVTVGTLSGTDSCNSLTEVNEYHCSIDQNDLPILASNSLDCPTGEFCQDGACVCQPSCSGKTCGDDGCGGVCGTCSEDYSCQDGGCVSTLTELDLSPDNIIDEKDVQAIRDDPQTFRGQFSTLEEVNSFIWKMRQNWKKTWQ
jgi:hypothetical protein